MSGLALRPSVMGIINVTPDSFSGDGILLSSDYVSQAVSQAEQMVNDGADILDVGGESSRPGSHPVSVDEEIRRVIPVISALKTHYPELSIAVDTVKVEVAERAILAGATLVNDISALSASPQMAPLIAQHSVKVVLMHNKAIAGSQHDVKIGGQFNAIRYTDVVDNVVQDLISCVDHALKAGIDRTNIILDPGIGFGKTPSQNVELIANLGRLKALEFPVLVGVSRKSFIGHILDLPINERLEGTAACVTACVLRGADILRVHDVKFMARCIEMATAIRDA